MKTNAIETPTNIVTLPRIVTPDRRARAHRKQPKYRFKILEFTNRGGSKSWRVSGITRTGKRLRENYSDAISARCRQSALEAEYLARTGERTTLRSTRLSDVQVSLAETVFAILDDDQDLLTAVSFWREHRHKHTVTESPRIDDAVDQYLVWLAASNLRPSTKRGWRIRINIFKNSIGNHRVADFTPELIQQFLDRRNVTPSGKDTDRRAVSRFFSWCIERPRRWTSTNPCREVKVDLGESAPPVVLSVAACAQLLQAAEAYKSGVLAPYVALCLFAGFRPEGEAKRISWEQVNLADGEIRIEANQSKTKRARVFKINSTLKRWLEKYEGKPFFTANWRKDFRAVKTTAGITTWTKDIMRHTAISHFFRASGSYGLTAEQFGTSEAIIKKHYQGRVSSEDTKRFYSIKPRAIK